MTASLITIRRAIISSETAAILLIAAVIALLGRPLNASFSNSLFIVIAIIWQCSIGISVWVRVFKPNRIELVDVLGPALATGAAVTTLGWFAVCRIPWMSPRLFALLTVLAAIDGLLKLRIKFSLSSDQYAPITAILIAVIGLGYHRIALLVLGVGLSLLITLLRISRSVTNNLFVQFKKYTISIIGLTFVSIAFLVQSTVSQNNETGFIPSNDMNFGEAVALGVVPEFKITLSPFTTSFRYHWLSSAWLGVMIRTFKIAPLIGPNLLTPLVVFMSTVCLVFSAVRKFNNSSSKLGTATLTALLIVAGASIGEQFNFAAEASPSNQLGMLWLLLGGYVLLYSLSQTKYSPATIVILFLSGFLIMGTKGPLAFVLIAAVTTHLFYLKLRKLLILHSLMSVIAISMGSIFAYIFIVSDTENGIVFFHPANGVVEYLKFASLLIMLGLTRIPIIVTSGASVGPSIFRPLAVGAILLAPASFFAATYGNVILYFVTGAIALGCFFSGINSDLTIRSKKYLKVILICLSGIVFLYSIIVTILAIYFSALPDSVIDKSSSEFRIELINAQTALALVLALIALISRIKKNLYQGMMSSLLIAIMSATTFGVYLGDSLSPELRKMAISDYGLDGGPDDRDITAQKVIESATWIRGNSENTEIVATNYSNDGVQASKHLVSAITQREVLIDSADHERLIEHSEKFAARIETTMDFVRKQDAFTAKALTDQKVDWFLLKTIDTEIEPNVVCAETKLWKCEFQNSRTLVIRFLKID